MTELNYFILDKCPQYIRALNADDIPFNDEIILKASKSYKLQTLKNNKVIPHHWTQEEATELLDIVKLYKCSKRCSKYYKDNIDKIKKQKEPTQRQTAKQNYYKNKDHKLKRQKLKYNLQKMLVYHKTLFLDTLNSINLLSDKFSKNKLTLGNITKTHSVVLSNTHHLMETDEMVYFKTKKNQK